MPMPPVPANDGDNPLESRLADLEVTSLWMSMAPWSMVPDSYVTVVLGFSWSRGLGRRRILWRFHEHG